MIHSRLAAAAAVLGLAAASTMPAPATPGPVFSAGHWLGQGEFYATHSSSDGSTAVSDGSFTFDMTVGVSGLVVGRMVMATSGTLNNRNAIATFEEISAGNGWVLSGTPASIKWDGREVVTGKITGVRVAMTVPMPGNSFHAIGHFEPQRVTCNTASGDLAVPIRQTIAAGANPSETTIAAPWTAFKADGGEGLKDPGETIGYWFEVIGEMDKAADADFKGMNAKQLAALIEKSEQVQAAMKGFMKCGSSQPGLSNSHTKTELQIFALQIATAQNALAKIGGHF